MIVIEILTLHPELTPGADDDTIRFYAGGSLLQMFHNKDLMQNV